MSREQLDNFITATADPSDLDVSAGSLWSPAPSDRDSLDGIWTKRRVDSARTSLNSALGLGELNPVSPIDRAFRFQEWWTGQGRFLPKHVLSQIGVNKPGVTARTSELEGRRNRAQGIKRFLGITETGDPLKQRVPSTLEVATGARHPGTEMTEEEKQAQEVDAKLQALSLTDLKLIRESIIESPLDFTAETSQAVDKEIGIKKHLPRVIEAISEKPMLIVWGTPLFDTFLGNIPGRTNAFDSLFGVEKGEVSNAIQALSRAREMILAEDPRLTTRMALGMGDTAADLIKFALLPDPSKIKAFSKLSAATKAAIGVGSRAGMVELLKAPASDEDIAERMETVAKAVAIGAVTGAVLSKIVTFVQDIPLKRQAAEIVKKFPQVTKDEGLALVKAIKDNELISFAIKPPIGVGRRIAPTGFRLGMAEIEKTGQFGKGIAKGVAKAATKGEQQIAAAAAKLAGVKPVIPKKIVTPQQAGPFGPGFEGKGEVPFRVVSAPAQVRRSIQAGENAVAKLKTRLAEQKGKGKLVLAKATAKEIAKREKDVETLIARHEVKLERTIAGAQAKIDKILRTKQFKEELRTDALSMVMAIPKDQRIRFVRRAFKVKTDRGLQKLALEVQEGMAKANKRIAIKSVAGRLAEIDTKKMPEPQRTIMNDLKNSVDVKKLTAGKEADLESLQGHVQRVAIDVSGRLSALDKAGGSTPTGIVPDARMKELDRLTTMNINDMEVEDIQVLLTAIDKTSHEAALKSHLMVRQGLKPLLIDNAAKKINESITPTIAGGRRIAKKAAGKSLPQPSRAVANLLKLPRRIHDSELNLERLVEQITTKDNDAMMRIFGDEMQIAEKEVAEVTMEISDAVRERFAALNFDSLKVLKEKVKGVRLGDTTFDMTKGQLLQLEMHFRSPDNIRAIMHTEGWHVERLNMMVDYPKDMKPVERIQQLNKALAVIRNDSQLSGLAQFTHDINPRIASIIEEEFTLLNGHPPPIVDLYTPRPRWMPKKIGGKTNPDFATPPDQVGPFQPRTGGTGRLILEDWQTSFLRQVQMVANLKRARALRNARIIVGSKAFQGAMINAGRKTDLDAMLKRLQNIQGFATTESMSQTFGRHIDKAITIKGLGARISSMGTAAMSYPQFLAEASWRAMFRVPQSLPTEYVKKLYQDSALLRMRDEGMFISSDLATQSTEEAFSLMFFGKPAKMSTKAFAPVRKGDKFAVTNSHPIAVKEIQTTKRNGKNIDPFKWNGRNVGDLPKMTTKFEGGYPTDKAFRFAAARRAEFLTRRTQPMGDMFNRSGTLQTQDIVTKTFFTKFRSALSAIMMSVWSAGNRAVKDPTPENVAFFVKAVTGATLSVLSVTIYKNRLRWHRNKGAAKIKDSVLGTFTFDEDAELKTNTDTLHDMTDAAIENAAKISTPLWVAMRLGKIAGDQLKPDSYNWNRDTLENPAEELLQHDVYEVLESTGDFIDAMLQKENFIQVEEGKKLTPEEIQHNEDILQRYKGSYVELLKNTLETGATFSKVPIAPYQEWIAPFLRETKIPIIKEMTRQDMDDPKALALDIARLYALETQLVQKKKEKLLPDNEDRILDIVRVFKSYSTVTTQRLQEADTIDKRRRIFKTYQFKMNTWIKRIDRELSK